MRALQSQFVKSVGYLTGATVFSQLLMLLILPLLTRLYTPEDFGVLAVFMSALGILGAVSSLRFHVAVPLPRTDTMGANLMALSLICVLIFAALITVGSLFLDRDLIGKLVPLRYAEYIWVVGLAVLILGIYNSFRFWAVRKKAFRRIAATRIEQGLGGAAAQVGLGFMGIGAPGLIIGQMISQGAGFFGLARRAIAEDRHVLHRISPRRILQAARLYDHYPKFSALEALFNTASTQMPLLIIVIFAGNAELGVLMLAMRIMQAPLSLVGTAVSQVYYAQAIDDARSNLMAETTSKVISGMARLGLGPLLFAAIVAPTLFAPIFGAQWERAGILLAWMAPWFMLQFLASPVSMALHVTNRQGLALMLQVSGLVLRVSAVVIAGMFFAATDVSIWYALSSAIFYLIYLVVVVRVAHLGFGRFCKCIADAIPFVAGWGAGAVLVLIIADQFPGLAGF